MKNILICGSIAYDSIMVFQDKFKNHILPDQIHNLNICFYVPEMKKNFGGTAGNIAYNLKLLRSNPLIMATYGDDFDHYKKWLESVGISKKYMKQISGMFTAQAFITTDQDDNQITAFHPGAMTEAHQNLVLNVTDKIDLAIKDIRSSGAKIIIGPTTHKEFDQVSKHNDLIFISPCTSFVQVYTN